MSSDRPFARREQALEAVRDVLLNRLKLRVTRDQIQPDTPLFGIGLGLDSVDAIDLVVGVEQQTGVRIPEDWQGRAGMRTVNKLTTLILDLQPEEVDDADTP